MSRLALVQPADATEGLDAFAPGPDRSSSRIASPADDMRAGSPLEDAAPELVWLVDAGDGLNEFTPRPDRLPLQIEPPALPLLDVPIPAPMDVPVPAPPFIADRTGRDVFADQPPRFDWIKRAGRAALVCSILAAAADGILYFQPAATPSAVESPEPAIDVPEDTAPLRVAADSPRAPALVAWTAPSRSPTVEQRGDERRARSAGAQDPGTRSVSNVAAPSSPRGGALPAPALPPREVLAADPPAAGRETLAGNIAPVAGSGSLSPAAVAAAIPAPMAPASDGAAPPAESPSPVVAGLSAAAPRPGETSRSASTDRSLEAVAGPPSREVEARAIENVLGRYRTAFNRLDAGAAVAVWPTANGKTLARAFERLDDQDVSFDNCTIEIFAGLAEAACNGTARYVPNVGSRTPKAEARRWKFSLRKANDEWLIDGVDAR